MVKQIQAAQKAARKAIEATYFGTLTVTELQKVKNEKSKLMEESEVVVLQDQPCRLSFEKLQTAIQSESAATITILCNFPNYCRDFSFIFSERNADLKVRTAGTGK